MRFQVKKKEKNLLSNRKVNKEWGNFFLFCRPQNFAINFVEKDLAAKIAFEV
jgi:hypothetical protein